MTEPTIQPMNPPQSGQGIHRAAAQGFAPAAADYLKGRPDYPAALDAWLRQTLGVVPGSTVVDLGAGTGKFTTRLLASGAHVIAVEPVASMRAKLASVAPAAVALDGHAEAIPLETGSVDALVCATAFHWFATQRALTEIHRVLKPGGMLGLVWNQRDTRVDWVVRLDAIAESRVDGSPRMHTGQWRQAFPHEGFTALEECRFAYEQRGPADDVIVARTRSSSVMSVLPAPLWAEVESELRELIESEPALRGRTEVVVPHVTLAYSARARPMAPASGS